GGVALGVGMLVDNSIVVLESIHRKRQQMPGARLVQAVAEGTAEVATAVTASTLTTVAVFLPLVFVEGVAGQLFTDQALTITYSLLASLLVALSFIPMALALRLAPVERDPGDPGDSTSHSAGEPAAASGRFARWLRFAVVTAPRVV